MTFLLSAPEAILRDLCDQPSQLCPEGPSWATPLPPLEMEQDAAPPTATSPSKARSTATAATPALPSEGLEKLLLQLKAIKAIEVYRDWGHCIARLDPLGLQVRTLPDGLTLPDFPPNEREQTLLFGDFKDQKIATVLERLEKAYGGTLTLEAAHLNNTAQKTWLRNAFEKNESFAKTITPDVQQLIFEGLVAAEGFERFLATKFPGAKRFGLEGAESFIPGLSQGLIKASTLGIQQIVLGMAHRGRLNVMANVFQVPFAWFLKYFRGFVTEETSRAGDVKYHMGAEAPSMTLLPNPSHLESVDPVVLGTVKAQQVALNSAASVLGILIHGDASFMGQGVVAESLSFAHLKGYETGGTLHVILNNQVGFTANPDETRSSLYASDIAKGYGIPILHVNGDDPEAVLRAFWIAVSFRQQFAQDIVIDLVCYRRNGHNETDEPAFTQPHMYDTIHNHPSTRDSYGQKLLSQKILTVEKIAEIQNTYHEKLTQIFDKPSEEQSSTAATIALSSPPEVSPLTGVPLEKLRDIGRSLATVPESFHLHPKLKRFMDNRLAMAEGSAPLDWSMAEALAFGTLLSEGTSVRLSGQDSGRGTFTQRHGVLIDQENQTAYVPLQSLSETAQITLLNSPLSEMGVMGFEFGYSQESPTTLVLWEAQFGDFANGAQIIIDQYIASSETKWGTTSGLVLLLPHAYEGQGAEHSSARLERFLQLAAEDNLQVANCSTPANYFHILRRQMKKSPQKPLILMTPKSLLRHKAAVSALEDFGPTTTFQPVLEDLTVPKAAVQRVILCSGKVYYDLLAARVEANLAVPLIRLEEIYPFPEKQLTEALAPYASPNTVLVWAQEEARNNGAWSFLETPLKSVAKNLMYKEVIYAGRREAAAPATGHSLTHTQEQAALVKSALGI